MSKPWCSVIMKAWEKIMLETGKPPERITLHPDDAEAWAKEMEEYAKVVTDGRHVHTFQGMDVFTDERVERTTMVFEREP